MKREILFRGKRIDNGEWVAGDLAHSTTCLNGKTTHHVLIGVDMDFNEVISETVGQFTGLHDGKEKRVFEGDVIKIGRISFNVVFYNHGFMMEHIITRVIIDLPQSDHFFEVIGNIHDTDKTDPEDLF